MKGIFLCLSLLVLVAAPVVADLGIVVGQDTFSYPDGALNGNGPWTGSATINEIAVYSGELSIVSNAVGTLDSVWAIGGYDPSNDVIWVRIWAKAGIGNPEYHWDLFVDDPAGLNLGRFYGQPGAIRGRIGGLGLVTDTLPLGTDWGVYEMIIDTAANTTTFYANGALFPGTATLSHSGTGAGDTLGRIRFTSWNRGHTDDIVFMDNLAYGTVPEPSSLMALGVMSAGMLTLIRRRRG